MYKIYDGKEWYEFESYQEMVNYLSQFNVDKTYNSFLSLVGNNENDCCYARVYTGWYNFNIVKIQRDHRILLDNNSIYDRNLVNDVLNHVCNKDEAYKSIRRNRKNKNKAKKYYSRWGFIPSTAYPDFRMGPWPFIHKHKGGSCYRKIKTFNEIKQTTDPEYYDEFTRKSRGKHLPTIWDDPIEDWRNHGWKASTRCRKQWEPRVINKTKRLYGKGCYVEKMSDNSDDVA